MVQFFRPSLQVLQTLQLGAVEPFLLVLLYLLQPLFLALEFKLMELPPPLLRGWHHQMEVMGLPLDKYSNLFCQEAFMAQGAVPHMQPIQLQAMVDMAAAVVRHILRLQEQ
jgi:hypothetical protein